MNILVCIDSYPDVVAKLSALLPGHTIRMCNPKQVMDNIGGADIIIPSIAQIDSKIIAAGKFGFIQQLGVGLDSIDIAAAEQAGVLVANIPGRESGNSDSVAELAMLLMLSVSRNLYKAKSALEAGRFAEPVGFSLIGKTVCVVGLGAIGQSVAKKLHGFDCRIIAVRERAELGAPPELNIEKVYSSANLNDAIGQADYVVLCLPQTSQSHHLFNGERLAAMKDGAFLVNVARGGIVDTQALCQALASGKLRGAALDVFEQEPVDPKNPLFQYNVVATPHVGGYTDAAIAGTMRLMVANIKRYVSGEKPEHLVNAPKQPRQPHSAGIS